MPTHQLRDKARLALVVTSFVTLDAEWESMARLRLTPHTRCAFSGFKRDLRPGRATPAVRHRESPARTAVRDAISATNPIWPVYPLRSWGAVGVARLVHLSPRSRWVRTHPPNLLYFTQARYEAFANELDRL